MVSPSSMTSWRDPTGILPAVRSQAKDSMLLRAPMDQSTHKEWYGICPLRSLTAQWILMDGLRLSFIVPTWIQMVMSMSRPTDAHTYPFNPASFKRPSACSLQLSIIVVWSSSVDSERVQVSLSMIQSWSPRLKAARFQEWRLEVKLPFQCKWLKGICRDMAMWQISIISEREQWII